MIAYCKTCGRFSEPGAKIGGATFAKIGVISNPCPYPDCNGTAAVIPGYYEADGNGVLQLVAALPEFVRNPVGSVEALNEIKVLLQQYLQGNAPAAAVQDKISSSAPALAPFALKFLTKERKDNILFWIAVLTFLIYVYSEFFKPNKDDEIKKMFADHLSKESKNAEEKKRSENKPVPLNKQPALNAPCPCGSGRKFKRCHGLKNNYARFSSKL